MSSRRCLRCGGVYGGDARFCPKDGSPLVDVQTPVLPKTPPSAGGGAGARTVERRIVPQAEGPGLDRAATLVDQILDRRYQVLKRLGEGGMAYVYQARELSSGDLVAIKVLSPRLLGDPSSVERLRREAGLAMRLNHPNVCRILRLGETEEGLIYLVMPFLRGELLSDREAKGGPMALQPGLDLLRQMCEGLYHAHGLQIIHRDLKPENVMLVSDAGDQERAVVMDFGLAKERRADPAVQKLTATGIILGTPEFMSPEQIRGRVLDGRSDIYALAVVAFEMFTGKLPFSGKSAQEIMIARLRGQPASLRQYRADLPEELDRVLIKAMNVTPEGRFATALEFAEALDGAGGGSGGSGFLSRLRGR